MIDSKNLSAKMLKSKALSEQLKNISDELLDERNGIELLVNAVTDFSKIIDQIDKFKQKYEALFLKMKIFYQKNVKSHVKQSNQIYLKFRKKHVRA